MNPEIVSTPTSNLTPAFTEITRAVIDFFPTLVAYGKNILGFLVGISLPISLFLVIVIVYSVEQIKRIRNKESEIYDTKTEPAYEAVPAGDIALTKRWNSIKEHIESQNPNDWRQAIMDADIILDDLLNKMGYQGESIGEKLKRVVRGDFATLDDAWEAHKVRNQIAHEGAAFNLSHHEAKHTIDKYRNVFEEFYYI